MWQRYTRSVGSYIGHKKGYGQYWYSRHMFRYEFNVAARLTYPQALYLLLLAWKSGLVDTLFIKETILIKWMSKKPL